MCVCMWGVGGGGGWNGVGDGAVVKLDLPI